jgi:hypothetical protein
MSGFQVFMWRDQPIPDPRAWARERGEDWVHYLEKRRELELVGTCTCPPYDDDGDDEDWDGYIPHRDDTGCTARVELVTRSEPGEMPAAFFDTRRQRGATWLEEVRREKA